MKVIGISIGGTKTAVTFANVENGLIDFINKEIFATDGKNPKTVINNIFNIIDSSDFEFDFISIISGGPLDSKNGTIICPPHLPGFNNIPIVTIFKEKYDVDVTLLNDADACALAEYKFGCGQDCSNFAYITFGTGIGSGLIINRKLFTGNSSMAGEIGHLRLTQDGPIGFSKVGSVEGWCAGGNIITWANIDGANDTKDIFDLAREKDKNAIAVIDKVAEKLGETISILIDLLNLDKVAIGGIYPRNLDLLENKVIMSAKNNAIDINFNRCKIVPSQLKERIDDYSSLMGVFMANKFNSIFDNYPELLPLKKDINEAINIIVNCYKNNGKVLVCGNGGSASDSAHIVGELMKGFMLKRELDKNTKEQLCAEFESEYVGNKLQKAVPCIDLTAQSSLITAFDNDVDPDLVFAQQVLGYSSNSINDIVIGLSTSGNSKNVVNALKTAKALNLKTIALTGIKNSEMGKLATVTIKAPAEETFRVQEYHLPIYHYICQQVEKRI